MAVSDLVKTTLGPKGMDKILKPISAGPRDESITVTNDGATILKSMHVDNPAAKILIGNNYKNNIKRRKGKKKSDFYSSKHFILKNQI